jgi:hypothetical protein
MGYDFKFEKHLARSLRTMEFSLTESAKKFKAVTRNDGPMSDDEDEGGEGLNRVVPPFPSVNELRRGGEAREIRLV